MLGPMKMAHTMIRVNDLEATIEFYTGFLGLREVRRKTLGDEATLVFLEADDGAYRLELTFNKDGRDYTLGDQFGHLAFHADDRITRLALSAQQAHESVQVHLRLGSQRV